MITTEAVLMVLLYSIYNNYDSSLVGLLSTHTRDGDRTLLGGDSTITSSTNLYPIKPMSLVLDVA